MSPEEIHRRHRHALSRLVPHRYVSPITGEESVVKIEPDADLRFINSLCEAIEMGPYVPVKDDPWTEARLIKERIEAEKAKAKSKGRKKSKGPTTLFEDGPEKEVDQYRKEF